ncbi:hypothetical protein V6U78_03990 [Marinospirillum sp. MEB164]|uniref:Uncharacterized protein n=1 Tax=Marinospirillum alkalitolerans TaxID=3123374 RepID=A0ABW8PWB0_9GAMM
MLNDRLKNWAVASQAVGLIVIVALETWLGRGEAGQWQKWVLIAMLACAALVALLRFYRHQQHLKEQARRRQVLEEAASDDEAAP